MPALQKGNENKAKKRLIPKGDKNTAKLVHNNMPEFQAIANKIKDPISALKPALGIKISKAFAFLVTKILLPYGLLTTKGASCCGGCSKTCSATVADVKRRSKLGSIILLTVAGNF